MNYPKYFPPLVSQMAAIGEYRPVKRSFRKGANIIQRSRKSLVLMIDLIQPIMIIILGVLVFGSGNSFTNLSVNPEIS